MPGLSRGAISPPHLFTPTMLLALALVSGVALGRDTVVVFNELMYNELGPDEGREWLEIHNQQHVDVDLGGWRITDGIEFTFPEGTIIPERGYLVIASDPGALEAATGVAGALGPFSGSLSNSGERLDLLDNGGRLMSRLDYGDRGDWPVGPDGSGFTLAKRDPLAGDGEAANWTTSAQPGGTPGAQNFPLPSVDSDLLLLAPVDAAWRYDDRGFAPDPSWAAVGFDDSTWPEGTGIIVGGGAVPDPGGRLPAGTRREGQLPVANASFEELRADGALAGWTAGGDAGHLPSDDPRLAMVPMPDGRAAGFTGPGGTLVQAVTGLVPGTEYTLRGFVNTSGAVRAHVAVDGTERFVFDAPDRSIRYRRFQANFTAQSPEAAITLGASGGSTPSRIAAWDGLVLTRGVPLIAQANFEEPVAPVDSGFFYNPDGSAWSGSGYAYSRSGQGFGTPPLEGSQAAALQGTASIAQVITGFEVGRQYVLAWYEADRENLGGNDYHVTLGGTEIMPQRTVTNPAWTEVRTAPFTAAAPAMELRFAAFNSGGGDRSVFIDDIRFDVVLGGPATGTELAAPPTATYFRRTVAIDRDPASFDMALRLEALADDGAVIYWNGQEAARLNMPAGPIGPATFAASPVGNAAFGDPVIVPGLPFNRGANTLAVRVHQADDGAGDLAFGLRAEAILAVPPPDPFDGGLVFNEVVPFDTGESWVELRNDGPDAIDIGGHVIEARAATRTLLPQVVPAGGLVVLGVDDLGFSIASGDRLFLLGPGRETLLDGVQVEDRPVARDAGGRWLYPAAPTPGSPNAFDLEESVVINEIMYHPAPYFEVVAEDTPQRVVEFGAAWRYYQDGPPPTGWNTAGFDDSSWAQGAALLYAEDSPLQLPKNTELELGQSAYYFRTQFDAGDLEDVAALRLSPFIDDGAVFYLNGQEVHRLRMPAGAVGHGTFAAEIVGNAGFDPPAVIPADALVPGTNTIAASVHQFNMTSSDVVFGLAVDLLESADSRPFRIADDEWLELYNRGAGPVDLSGWRFADGISYRFRDGTVLDPGEYLVLAKHPVEMAATWPGIRIVGPYDGSLSRSGERLLLVDANGNPADEVTYDDHAPWPEMPDGGGPSLELVDPRGDNNLASAWASSDETARGAWQWIEYRGMATDPPNSNDPSGFNELVLGLQNAGAILVDDVSVIEDPGGAAIERIQNGTFNAGAEKWRFNGNHGASRITTDPDEPSNRVLRIESNGAGEHMSNNVETTFVGNAPIRTDVEYLVRFRARWVEGGPRLVSRLYFNRLARTTVLEFDRRNGTPGARNSRWRDNTGPTMGDWTQWPVRPAAAQPVTVTVPASDPDGVDGVDLLWRLDGQGWNTVAMEHAGGGIYAAEIPGHGEGTLVQYYFRARDNRGATRAHPAAGDRSSVLYEVEDNRQGVPGRQTLRLLMTRADSDFLHDVTNIMSNAHVPATLVVDDRILYQDIGVRMKGSGYGRISARAGFNVRFNSGRLYRGLHESIAIDRNGGPTAVGISQLEMVAKHVAFRAAGIGTMYDDVANVIAPRALNTGHAQVLMARYNDDYLDSDPYYDSDGEVFKYELVYYHEGTTTGDPEGPKGRPSAVKGVDFVVLGEDKSNYRWTYLLRNRRIRDDYGPVMDFTRALALDGPALDAAVRATMDIDRTMRYGAYMSLTGIADTYWTGTLPHNFSIYVTPGDRRLSLMPWDSDHAFHPLPLDGPLEPPGFYLMHKITDMPRNKRLLYGHAHHMMRDIYTREYLAPWIRHYGDKAETNFDADLFQYIDRRREIANGQFPPEVPFQVTTNGGNPLSVGVGTVVLTGTAWIDIKELRIVGRPGLLEVEWPTLTDWRVVVPLAFGMNEVTFEGIDYDGEVAATTSITITTTVGSANLADSLKVTELMYEPLGGQTYEFIEFQNTGLSAIDLSGAAIVDGIAFNFPARSLEPGAYALAVANRADFEFRYGLGFDILGEYSGALSNGGERVEVQDALGRTVIEFTYDDTRGWPLAADGGGHSLVPLARAAPNQGARSLDYPGNWRASTHVHGSPGGPDPATPAGPRLSEFAAHTDIDDPAFPDRESNDWIEIVNTSDVAVNLDGWYLSDRIEDPRRWAFPPSMSIGPSGRISLDEITGFNNPLGSGFALSKAGEQVILSYLPGTADDRVVDAVRFEGQANGLTLARTQGADFYWNTAVPTRDLPNGPRLLDIVIDEIMYNPPPEAEVAGGTEYLELHNPTASTVRFSTVAGPWRLADGIGFDFPPSFELAPGGHALVVPFDPSDPAALAAFAAAYGLDPVPNVVLGPFTGRLDNAGERISLERPDNPDVPGDPLVWEVVDEVYYFDQVPFPASPDGAGDALHRDNLVRSGNDPLNWNAAPPDIRAYRLLDPSPSGWFLQ